MRTAGTAQAIAMRVGAIPLIPEWRFFYGYLVTLSSFRNECIA
jgi:hypothetical protein